MTMPRDTFAAERLGFNQGFEQMVGHMANESECPPTAQSRRWAELLQDER